jgi:flagellar biosynthetic protein FliR
MSINNYDIAYWLAHFFWPLCRVGGVFMVAPMLSHGAIPARVKAAIAVLFSVCIAPLVPISDAVAVFDFGGIIIAIREIMVGLMIGFAMRLAFSAAEFAGSLIGIQSGFAFASVYDHQMGSQMDPLSHFYQLFALMVFVSLNGHLLLLAAMAKSFHTFPIAADFSFLRGWGKDLIPLVGTTMGYGLLLLLPLLATLILTNIVLVILSRSAPQLNLFSVGFQVTLLVAIILTLPSMGSFSSVMANVYESAFTLIDGWTTR